MKSCLIIIITIVLITGCANENKNNTTVNVAAGSVERIDSFPSKYVSARNVDVWLPAEYDENDSYAVLYMHDGQMLYDSTTTWNKQEWGVDEVLTNLMNENKIRKSIVVGIWNSGEGRHADYFPQKPFERLDKTFRDSLIYKAKRNEQNSLFSTGINSDNYLKFLVKELKPYIDSAYTTKSEMKNTFVAGSSMGGLISIYAICEYPKVFGGAACLSTHWLGTFASRNNPIPAAFIDYLSENLPDPTTHSIYFDYGTATLDSLYGPFQLQVDSVMRVKGFNQNHWKTMKFEGADHSEKSWHERLHIPVAFLLGNR